MRTATKHAIGCRCILSQHKNLQNHSTFKFVVFSILDEDDKVLQTIVACPNCGILHKITDLCKSEILKSDASVAVITKDDVLLSLSEKYVQVLTKHDVDLPTLQQVAFLIEEKRWGEQIILTKEFCGKDVLYKVLIILGDNMFKLENKTSTGEL